MREAPVMRGGGVPTFCYSTVKRREFKSNPWKGWKDLSLTCIVARPGTSVMVLHENAYCSKGALGYILRRTCREEGKVTPRIAGEGEWLKS